MKKNIYDSTTATISFAPSLKELAVYHDFEQRNIDIAFPKGYYYLPNVNDKILLSSMSNPVLLGCIGNKNINIKPGEIIIKNDSGAYIKLLTNGDIEINSLKITVDGKIIKK